MPGWPKNVIAVAIADNPLGPYKDALGRPLINKATGNIDPTALVDDDGQAYLYWGNPRCRYGGDYIKVCSVNFGGKGAAKFMASVAGAMDGGAIELRLDDPSGKLVGTLNVKATGSPGKWETQFCDVSGAKGVPDLILEFTGGNGSLFNFNWWKCE